jgi:hypothetical protein
VYNPQKENPVNILKILTELLSLIGSASGQYGPILVAVEGFIKAGDWAGLIAYLESLASPTPPTPAPAAAKLSPLISRLKSATA